MWTKNEDGDYFLHKEFNGITYRLGIHPWVYSKSILFYVSLSSGNKRKELDNLMPKQKKTSNGIEPLLWAKETLLSLNTNEFIMYASDRKKKKYLCIQWSDNRRRNIYSRLSSFGFGFRMIEGEKVLCKKLNQ